MYNTWKPNWEESKLRFNKWWDQNGFLIGSWSGIREGLHEETEDAGLIEPFEQRFLNYKWRAKSLHYGMTRMSYPLDILPMACVDLGPGSLATLIGAKPVFDPKTVWFEHAYDNITQLPSLGFDESTPWWQLKMNTFNTLTKLAGTKYMVGCMDLVENLDILSSLIGAEESLYALMDEPELVLKHLYEINKVWIEAYERIYQVIKQEDNSSGYSAFSIWGTGKTAKLQCDYSAMISPDQFGEFIVPMLAEQCQYLDHSMFHLDGKECICHLDHLLSIKELNAIEWTPDPSSPGCADSYWFDMYREILDAGKSVQLVGMRPEQIEPVLNAVGTNGVYMLCDFPSVQAANETEVMLKKFGY